MFFRKIVYFRKIIFTLVFLFSIFLLFANEKESKNNDDWIIAVSEFESENLSKKYQVYKTIVPQMFLFYLDEGGKRLVPFEEKKMRAVMEVASNKLKLIKERAKLINEKDDLFLSIEDKKNKLKKEKQLIKKIKEKEEEIQDANFDIKIEENKFFSFEPPKDVKIWKDGQGLYKVSENSNLAQDLKNDKISALVSGSIKDISGYMLINVKIDTGLKGLSVYEFYDAGPYNKVEEIVYSLSRQIYSVVQNTKPVKIYFDIQPKETKLYIDNRKITDFSKPLILYQGIYQISASADNYLESTKQIEIKDKHAYKLKIDLKKIETVQIGFNLIKTNPYLFYKTQYAATLPGIITVPKTKSILEFEKNNVSSFGLFDGGKVGSPNHIQNMIVKLNKKSVKDSIELQRKIMYWSLGALYISLPFTMITKARLDDKVRSFGSKKLPQTKAMANEINKYNIMYRTFQGISISLGVNYLVQLILYLVKADRALPRNVIVNSDLPVYKENPKKIETRTTNKKTDKKVEPKDKKEQTEIKENKEN